MAFYVSYLSVTCWHEPHAPGNVGSASCEQTLYFKGKIGVYRFRLSSAIGQAMSLTS